MAKLGSSLTRAFAQKVQDALSPHMSSPVNATPAGAPAAQDPVLHRGATPFMVDMGQGAGLAAQNPFGTAAWDWGGRHAPAQGKGAVATTRADLVSATTSSTVTVDVGGSVTGMVDVAGDHDWYRVTLVAGRNYDMALRGRDSGGGTLSDPYLALRSSTGALLKYDNDTGVGLDSLFNYTATNSGTYFLDAYGNRTTIGSFTLAVTERDILSTIASTAAITAGGTQTSRIETAGDTDWFRVTLTAGVTYVIQENGATVGGSGAVDTFIRGIYSSAGKLIANTSNDDYAGSTDSQVTFTPGSTGTYFIAAGAYGNDTGGYELRVNSTAPSDLIAASTATTGTITVADPAVAGSGHVAGVIDSARDVDWYRVTLTAGTTYTIQERGSASGNGTLSDPNFIGVYTAAGVLISGTGNDDAPGGGLDSYVTFTPTTTGTYYLAAAGYNTTIGTYDLSISANATASTDLAASSLTTGTITVGGTATSTIDTAGDSDWFGVDLVAGHTYLITQNGAGASEGTLSDPYFLGIYDSNGLALSGTADDNSGGSSNALVSVTITQSGHYYLAASATGSTTGTYTLHLTEAADTTAPTLVALSPADNATAVAASSNLSLTFSEAVAAGTGAFTISNGTDIRVISAADSRQITFAGSTVTINPTADLATGSSYSITYDGAAVRDLAGNAAAAVTSATTWNFTTAATAGPADTWTILVYVAGDNNLESFALSDLNEMEQVNYPSSVNVYALADRAAGYSTASGNWTDTREGHIIYDGTNNTVTSLANASTSRGELNTGLGANLTAFINRAVAADPAQHYALILWDHGGGISGSCWDDGSGGDNLTLSEMRSAIDASVVDHFDIVGFDACLMSMAEQAFDLRGLADILVASEELEPGDGWDYNVFLQALANNPNMSAQQLASSMVSSYAPQYAGQSDITMAATNISGMAALEQGLDSFVSAALALGSGNSDWAAMRTAAAAARAMPSDASFDYADLGDFMSGVASRVTDPTLKAAAQSVLTAVHSAVFAQSGTVAAATGLSIYLPYGSEVVDSSYTSANYSFLQAVNWDGYLALL